MGKKKKKMNQHHKDGMNLLKEMFELNTEYLKEENYDPVVAEELNFTQPILGKRMLAARRFLPRIHTAFSHKYSSFSYIDSYVGIISVPNQGTRCIDNVYFPFLGAAIWLLDYFKENDLMPELMGVLPKECNSIEEYGMPLMKDFTHPEQMINAMIALIMERNNVCKEQFDKVYKMVNNKVVSNLKKLYEKNILDYIDIYIAYAHSNREKRDAIVKSAIDDFEIEKHREELNDTRINPVERLRLCKELESMVDDVVEIEERLVNIFCEKESRFLTASTSILNATHEALVSIAGEDNAKKLIKFGNGSPYEICAAYLFLTVDDDDLLYLTIPSAVTLSYAVYRLPWNSTIKSENLAADITNRSYDLIYECINDSSDKIRRNYQQAFYSISNYIAPRQLQNAIINPEFLSEFNIPKEVCGELFSLSAFLDSFDNPMRTDLCKDNCDDECQEEAETLEEQTLEKLKSQNEVLLQKLKKMQLLVSEEKRNNTRLNRELKRQHNQHESEHAELISLREALFMLQRAEPEEVADTKVHFPFETKRNICVFGGHDNWTKAIRPMLPNVKFINREITPHPDLIKNADVIWLQTNSMSHAYYNQIISVVRTYNIVCKYFGYASAQKCAEQLVENEV